MILADTSVWIEHFRRNFSPLQKALSQDQVMVHPIIIGELAMGTMHKRAETIQYLKALQSPIDWSHKDCLDFIERHKLYGHGLGWNDAHVLLSAQEYNLVFWTLDKRLLQAAMTLGINTTFTN